MRREVLISDDKTVDPSVQQKILAEVDAEVRQAKARTVESVVDAVLGAEGLIVDAATPVTADVFEAVDSLQVVGRAGIGVDNVDIDAAESHGVTVVHDPAYSVDEVATHALALLLAVARNVHIFDRQTTDGGWNWKEGRPIHRLRGSTLGLVGFGKISRRLAAMVQGMGLDVLAYDPYVPDHEFAHFDVEPVGFEDLLARSRYVSIHVPLYDDTRHLFDRAAFEQMRNDAIVINTARGPVVDEDALLTALDTDEIAKAGIDVMVSEPPDESPLLDREDVIVTPHTSWYSEASRRDLSKHVARDVARVLAGEEPRSPVNTSVAWL
ncbi:C-terminal binding protein [Halocatena salina]|uniref:C-terminal binding protein n=1 Tax=Halocatena salina TaxID=2934340 RepID=A0A8U0A6U7_9EURY|nr:C-terminal binding protein [Halocatena salina]UPM44724.1 C-terminal binding protein [Halocatena salina]